jgi:hypothetical protein
MYDRELDRRTVIWIQRGADKFKTSVEIAEAAILVSKNDPMWCENGVAKIKDYEIDVTDLAAQLHKIIRLERFNRRTGIWEWADESNVKFRDRIARELLKGERNLHGLPSHHNSRLAKLLELRSGKGMA